MSNPSLSFDCVSAESPTLPSSPWAQNVVCGHGTRSRNLTCVVSDGSLDNGGRLVDEELCGGLELMGGGLKPPRLTEACSLPCPGNSCWEPRVCPHTPGKVTPGTKRCRNH